MHVITPGHTYDLQNKHSGVQRLQFFKDLPETEAEVDGVLCQEVMRALIDRYLRLFEQAPCVETTEIILKLRECLTLAEKRAFAHTLDKSYRKSGQNIEQVPVQANGHIFSFN